MITNLSSYLSKLIDKYNNIYHHSTNKKPINANYSAFTEKIEVNPKPPNFKVKDRVRITKLRIYLAMVILKIGQEKHLLSILF